MSAAIQDLSVLRSTNTGSQDLSLEQLDVVFGSFLFLFCPHFCIQSSNKTVTGATIGSAAIDRDFKNLVKARLEEANLEAELHLSPEEAGWEMMKSRDFQNTKCEHGSLDDTPIFSIPIPKLNLAYANSDLGIENGEMLFSRSVESSFFESMSGLRFMTETTCKPCSTSRCKNS